MSKAIARARELAGRRGTAQQLIKSLTSNLNGCPRSYRARPFCMPGGAHLDEQPMRLGQRALARFLIAVESANKPRST